MQAWKLIKQEVRITRCPTDALINSLQLTLSRDLYKTGSYHSALLIVFKIRKEMSEQGVSPTKGHVDFFVSSGAASKL